LNILLAEDNQVNQVLAVKILQKMGHHVTVTNNGQEAFRAYQHHHFDLVILDVQMPLLNGYETTHRIRDTERNAGGHIPIIAMTQRDEGRRQENASTRAWTATSANPSPPIRSTRNQQSAEIPPAIP
jgi:CheY-like chemotaxis protein